jgi:hypothetical protein
MPTKTYEYLFELANLWNGLLVFKVRDKHPDVVMTCLNTVQLNAVTHFPIAMTLVVNLIGSAVAVDEYQIGMHIKF